MQQRLQDVHGIVVELDESLGCAVPLLASHLPSSVDSSESASSTPTSSSTPLGTTAAALAERAERAEAVEACRQWLKEAQSYVMHLQRQLESLSSTFAEDSPQWVQCVSYSAEALERTAQDIRAGGTEVSSIHCGVRSLLILLLLMLPPAPAAHLAIPSPYTSTHGAGTCVYTVPCCAHLHACAHTIQPQVPADLLCARVPSVLQVSHGTSRSSSPDAWRPRAVARSAQLPYRSHWAHKVAL